jgi:hypothetical protein
MPSRAARSPHKRVRGVMGLRTVDPKDALKTYRYLRLGILGAIVLLAASVAIEVWRAPDCWQQSISGYYYTPVRAVFVGVLMAIGLALIVIKGPPLEDICFNVAGMLAPIVAIVPTTSAGTCSSILPEADPAPGGELASWVIKKVENNFYALAFVGFVGLTFACYLYLRDRKSETPIQQLDKNMRISAVITGGILVILMGTIVVFGTEFFTHVHLPAAGLMFAALIVAAIAKARERKGSSTVYFGWYSAVAGLMFFGGIAAAAIPGALGSDHVILFLEIWEIAMFVVFWVVQTKDNWEEEPAC